MKQPILLRRFAEIPVNDVFLFNRKWWAKLNSYMAYCAATDERLTFIPTTTVFELNPEYNEEQA